MKKQSEEFRAKLRETLKPGDTLYTVLRSVSRSGMSRVIDVYLLECVDGQVEKRWLSYWIAQACGFRFQDYGIEGIKIAGCGMDMGFEIVYQLGRVLYPAGVPCAGERCVSNDHSNGERDRAVRPDHVHRDGGYAFRQQWL